MDYDFGALLYQALDEKEGLRLHFNSKADRERARNRFRAFMAREFRRWGESDWAELGLYRDGDQDLVISKRDTIQFTVEPYDKREK